MFNYTPDGKLIVDELIIDPSLPMHVVVRIGAAFYMLHHAKGTATGRVSESALQPYKRQPQASWYRPTGSYQYWVHGLAPRSGYAVEVGRPATEKEFAAIVAEHQLTDDDISDVFTDTAGGLYGKEIETSFPARQIRVKSGEDALALERTLRDKGIQASSGSPGRVNIRVEQPVKL